MDKLGGWAIQESCYEFIKKTLPKGSTILELGSGIGTDYLSKHYKMYSIENYLEWVDKYDSTYIFAPIEFYNDKWTAPDLPGDDTSIQSGWYNPELVKNNLPESYDLILVDGPNGSFGRGGFLKHIDMFNTNVPIIFDDINRECEMQLMIKVAEHIKRKYYILDDKTGYIL
jgi:hypothetical protein